MIFKSSDKPETIAGNLVLLVTFVGGMIDLVVLPIWITALINDLGFAPQQAGAVVSLYILGVLIANAVAGPFFAKLPSRLVVGGAFAVTCGCFLLLRSERGFEPVAILHLLGGLGAGTALSCVNGTIGRSINPHRLFAMVNIGVGIFGIAFFATMPPVVSAHGIGPLFVLLAAVTGAGVVFALLGFPKPALPPETRFRDAGPLRWAVRVLAFLGVATMTVAQSMIFSFLQKIGQVHGFSAGSITELLTASAFVNLGAPIAAGVLQRRLSPIPVAVTALICHGCASLIICESSGFLPYALAGSLLVFMVIFGHIFMFGFISRIDPSGRLPALTPAMLMTGTAIGPVLGGIVVGHIGYEALGFCAAGVAWVSASCYALCGVTERSKNVPELELMGAKP